MSSAENVSFFFLSIFVVVAAVCLFRNRFFIQASGRDRLPPLFFFPY